MLEVRLEVHGRSLLPTQRTGALFRSLSEATDGIREMEDTVPKAEVLAALSFQFLFQQGAPKEEGWRLLCLQPQHGVKNTLTQSTQRVLDNWMGVPGQPRPWRSESSTPSCWPALEIPVFLHPLQSYPILRLHHEPAILC